MSTEIHLNIYAWESSKVSFQSGLTAYLLDGLPSNLSRAQVLRIGSMVEGEVRSTLGKYFDRLYVSKSKSLVWSIVFEVINYLIQDLEEQPLKGRLFTDKKMTEEVLSHLNGRKSIGTEAPIVMSLLYTLGEEETQEQGTIAEVGAQEIDVLVVDQIQVDQHRSDHVADQTTTYVPDVLKTTTYFSAENFFEIIKGMNFAEILVFLQQHTDSHIVVDEVRKVEISVQFLERLAQACNLAYIQEPDNTLLKLGVWGLTISILNRVTVIGSDVEVRIAMTLVSKSQQFIEEISSFGTNIYTTNGELFVPPEITAILTWEEKRDLLLLAVTNDNTVDMTIFNRNLAVILQDRQT